jgi:hypothetical protein
VTDAETTEEAIARVLESKVGWRVGEAGDIFSRGYTYDPRQTDHAWIELEARHFHLTTDRQTPALRSGPSFQDVEWWPLVASTINGLTSTQAHLVREAVRRLIDQDVVDRAWAMDLLTKTG